MNFIKKNFSLLVIAVLVIIILLQRSCTSTSNGGKEVVKINGKKYEVIKRETDTVRVEVAHNVYKAGKDIYHEVPVYINVPANVDTASILKDYYAMRVYKDTLKLKDSLGYIAVTDSISKNVLLGRTWDAKVNKTTVTNTIYLKELSNQLYLGGSLGTLKPNNLTIGANAILKTKKDHMYGLGFGVTSELNTYIQGSLLWKISLKK